MYSAKYYSLLALAILVPDLSLLEIPLHRYDRIFELLKVICTLEDDYRLGGLEAGDLSAVIDEAVGVHAVELVLCQVFAEVVVYGQPVVGYLLALDLLPSIQRGHLVGIQSHLLSNLCQFNSTHQPQCVASDHCARSVRIEGFPIVVREAGEVIAQSIPQLHIAKA